MTGLPTIGSPTIDQGVPYVEIEIDQLFGLPAHPLLVHAVVVLLPLAAFATIVCAAVPRARRPYAPIALGLALAALFSVILAQGAGEKLEDDVEESHLVDEHTEAGDQVLPWAIGLAVMAAAVTTVDVLSRRRPGLLSGAVTGALVVLTLVAAVGSTVTVIKAGHSGSKAVWSDVEEEDGDNSGPGNADDD